MWCIVAQKQRPVFFTENYDGIINLGYCTEISSSCTNAFVAQCKQSLAVCALIESQSKKIVFCANKQKINQQTTHNDNYPKLFREARR